MQKSRIDFLNYGYRCAIRGQVDLAEEARKIKIIYGEEACFQFETGATLAKDYCQRRPVEPVAQKELGYRRVK